MRSSAKNKIQPLIDDLFSSEKSRDNTSRQRVVELPLSELHPFRNHPFKVADDEKMQDTAQSIREHGVLVPAIVRPRKEGGYEIVAGHRRHFASQIAGLDTMPAIVRDLDDDAATIIMVDSNLQRETLLPSERAWAYRMKLEAMHRKAGRPSRENSGQLDPNFNNRRSNVIVAEQAGESVKQLQRFIRLTELLPELLEMLHHKSCISMQDFLFYTPVSASPPRENCRFVNDVNVLTTILTTIQRKTSIFSMTSRFVSIVECA